MRAAHGGDRAVGAGERFRTGRADRGVQAFEERDGGAAGRDRKSAGAKYRPGTWAPAKMVLGDRELRLMGLPSKAGPHLTPLPRSRRRLSGWPAGSPERREGGWQAQAGRRRRDGGATAGPTAATFAGAGFFGIRPGALLLTVTDEWSAGAAWPTSTALLAPTRSAPPGTAARPATSAPSSASWATARTSAPVPVLLDFGAVLQQHRRRRHRPGLGPDLGRLRVPGLVTPTMAFWGGPIGMYTSTGEVVAARPDGRDRGSTEPNPTLVQQVVHYGHGAGHRRGRYAALGNGHHVAQQLLHVLRRHHAGRLRLGLEHVTGDASATTARRPGINTHIYVDASLRSGLGTWRARARRWSAGPWPTARSCPTRRRCPERPSLVQGPYAAHAVHADP